MSQIVTVPQDESFAGHSREMAELLEALIALRKGKAGVRLPAEWDGLAGKIAGAFNQVIEMNERMAAELQRLNRTVGKEGKLDQRLSLGGVDGFWYDSVDHLNELIDNLVHPTSETARVIGAVAQGDLSQVMGLEVNGQPLQGEFLHTAKIINTMVMQLGAFASEVTRVAREVGTEGKLGGQAKVPGVSGTWKGLTENVNQLAANLTIQVRAIAEVATAVTKGDLTRRISVEAQGEVAVLKDTINEMIRNLRDTTQKNTEQDWLKTNLAKFSRMLQGQRDLTNVGRTVLSELCPVVSSQQAEFYIMDGPEEAPYLTLLASFASGGRDHIRQIALGEGIVGQCALEKRKIIIEDIPEGYFKISSGLGEATPRSLLVLPLLFEGQVKGVLELASFNGFNPTHQALLDQLTESIGIVLNTIEANMRTEDLLSQSQSLAQQLQTRQEQLEQTNEELQEKAHLLAKQNQEVEHKNKEVEQARQELEDKAKQLALTSKYKSEFLANMSHELRTPLNSLLILSDQLTKNAEGNLTPRQTDFAKIIHSSGNDLLMLINDILDLSKIESGTVLVEGSELRLEDLQSYVTRTFKHVAESKNVEFITALDPRLPKTMFTDAKRLQQIIKNLLSNAFKFTHEGQVRLTVEPVTSGWSQYNEDLNRASGVLAFTVADTGIGISEDKQMIIFEAFQQADGSTSRKYGGTGLGLAISRELSRLLGGEIRLVSRPGHGSAFTLYLPVNFMANRNRKASGSGELTPKNAKQHFKYNENHVEPIAREPESGPLINEVGDDRDIIRPGDDVVMIVENDLGFARFLLDTARERGFKGLVTSRGAAALAMVNDYMPDAVLLDVHLADMPGWRVLDRLKNDMAVRHIPVCVISTDESMNLAFDSGAYAFIAKPLQSRDILDQLVNILKDFKNDDRKNILVIDSDEKNLIENQISHEKVIVLSAKDKQSASQIIKKKKIDCVIVTPESASILTDLAESLKNQDSLIKMAIPVIVYGPGDLDENFGKGLSAPFSIRHVHSLDRLKDIVALDLHRKIDKLPPDWKKDLESLHNSAHVLDGRKVLVVDDDARNIFALASVLEEHNMDIVSAESGREAINMLQNGQDVDIVLMDIMMPEMDGMETIREIRKISRMKGLPIVAVTAKAMKGDREKCIDAGAWDYLSKPVDTEQLMRVMRAWLHR